VEHVGWRRVEIDRAASTIRLPDPEQRIGIGGIGKGWSVDRAAAVLESRGFFDYTVAGGGDLRVRGAKPDGPWTIGIAHPRRTGGLIGRVRVDRGSIVTSGDYQRFFEVDGVRYHHILDPRTGRPARGAVSVTVIAPDATAADALSTGLFVLGPARGIEVAEALPGVEALIVDERLELHRTSGFPALLDEREAGGAAKMGLDPSRMERESSPDRAQNRVWMVLGPGLHRQRSADPTPTRSRDTAENRSAA
jgi:thiamine biosynthesis lipoprotein